MWSADREEALVGPRPDVFGVQVGHVSSTRVFGDYPVNITERYFVDEGVVFEVSTLDLQHICSGEVQMH